MKVRFCFSFFFPFFRVKIDRGESQRKGRESVKMGRGSASRGRRGGAGEERGE